MRSFRSHEEHREAVSRRLAQLSAELSRPLADEPGEQSGHTRIRPGRIPELTSTPPTVAPTPSVAASAPSDVVPARPVPVPGRHAARRRRPPRGPARWPFAAVDLGWPQLSVVAVAAAVGLAVTCWWLLRSDSEELRVPTGPAAPLVTAVTPAGVLATGPSTPATPEVLVVHVAGKVRHPGIQVLEPGARVADAVAAAGGARRGVDLGSLNLARRVVDGEQILVGLPGGASGPAPPGGAPTGAAPLLVNLNTAGQAELEALPEIGPVTAQAIIAWRDAHGGFSSVDQLLDVDGIGEATLSRVAPLVTV